MRRVAAKARAQSQAQVRAPAPQQTQPPPRALLPPRALQLATFDFGAALPGDEATPPCSAPEAREMSVEEVKRLKAAMLKVQAGDAATFGRMLRLLRAAIPGFDGEVNLNALDSATLWRLHQLVVSARLPAPKAKPKPRARPIPPTAPAATAEAGAKAQTQTLAQVAARSAAQPRGICLAELTRLAEDDDATSVSDSGSDLEVRASHAGGHVGFMKRRPMPGSTHKRALLWQSETPTAVA